MRSAPPTMDPSSFRPSFVQAIAVRAGQQLAEAEHDVQGRFQVVGRDRREVREVAVGAGQLGIGLGVGRGQLPSNQSPPVIGRLALGEDIACRRHDRAIPGL
jgi:hypothetical protein